MNPETVVICGHFNLTLCSSMHGDLPRLILLEHEKPLKSICNVSSFPPWVHYTVKREIFASINFRESPTNTPEKKFAIFNFTTWSQSKTMPPTIWHVNLQPCLGNLQACTTTFK